MREAVEQRLRALARRAGVSGVPSAAVAAATLLVALAVLAAAWRWWPRGSAEVEFNPPASEAVARSADAATSALSASDSATGPEAAATTLCVHVVGAVMHPGVYELPAGSRVVAAVTAAGGMSSDAAGAGVNLATRLEDGQQVSVPTNAEFDAAGGTANGATMPSGRGGSGTSAAAPPGPVDINAADAAVLDTLPGIGPSTAAKIVAERESNGRFATVDDLGRVPGIGPKKLEQLRPLVRVR